MKNTNKVKNRATNRVTKGATKGATDKITVIGCSLENCVHTLGILNFFRLLENRDVNTSFLGAAISIESLVNEIKTFETKNNSRASLKAICLGYRLMPGPCLIVLQNLKKALESIEYKGLLFFGGTPENAAIAKKLNIFDLCFYGDETQDDIELAINLIRGDKKELIIKRSHQKKSFGEALYDLSEKHKKAAFVQPLIRHHFGLPNLKDTIEGVKKISISKEVDIISLSPDQTAQASFFRPNEQNSNLDGSGGIPLRKKADLKALYNASQCGNNPWLRIYSGTRDLQKWAELSLETIDNAWGAIPLCWYSQLDGRSNRPVAQAIKENISVIKWYAQKNIPIEINEAHHWSLREAPDTIAAAMTYISARIAKKAGVKQYIAQYMFNNPAYISNQQDLGKMLAYSMLLNTLEEPDFNIYRQVRAGLAHFSVNNNLAKGQLAMTATLMSAFKPHIFHVVGFTEGTGAAGPNDVIESCQIVRGVFKNLEHGIPNLFKDPAVLKSAVKVLKGAYAIINAIDQLGQTMDADDPLSNPDVIAKAIEIGILDAPHLIGQPCALGRIKTGLLHGGCYSLVEEPARLESLFKHNNLDPQLLSKGSHTSTEINIIEGLANENTSLDFRRK